MNICPVRILHVVSGDLWAGAEVMALNLIRQQNSDPACCVAAVVMNHGALERHLIDNDIEVTVVDEARTTTVSAFFRVSAVAGEFCPDVIHTHRQKENVIGSLVALLRGCASIRTEHGWNEHPATIRNFVRWTFQIVDRACGRFLQKYVIAVSEDLRTRLLAKYRAQSVVTIENGIDFPQTLAAAKRKSPIRRDDGYHLGIVGRIVPVKRVDKFLRAAQTSLATTRDRPTFHVIGDGPLMEEMKSLSAQLDINECIVFHGHLDSAVAAVAHLDGLVICSDHEGLPMVALEAGVLQIPIVTVPLPSLSTLLENGASGVVCAGNSVDDIVAGIERLREHDFQKANLPDFEQHYSIKSTMIAYREIYLSISENRRE